jgi:hypothetical protein
MRKALQPLAHDHRGFCWSQVQVRLPVRFPEPQARL